MSSNLIGLKKNKCLHNLGKETDIKFQEAWTVQNKINSKRSTTRHTLIKIAKIKDKREP